MTVSAFANTSLDPLDSDFQLEKWLPPHVLRHFTMLTRRHYEKLTDEGRVSVNGQEVMFVGPNLLWTARGMEPITKQDLDGVPKKLLYGPEADRRSETPSVPRFGDRSNKRVTFAQEPEVPVDSPEYLRLLEAWSKVPNEAHWSWKEGLLRLAVIPAGYRTELALRQLVSEAIDGEARDAAILEERMRSTATMDSLTDYDLLTVLPMAFGRFLGFEPPSETFSNVWVEYFVPLAKDKRTQESVCISCILSHLKTAKYEPTMKECLVPAIQESFDKLLQLILASFPGDWFGSWTQFVVPRNEVPENEVPMDEVSEDEVSEDEDIYSYI